MPSAVCEVCIESLDGALAAQEAGAHRIELCSGLAEGGLTPSAGLIHLMRQRIRLPVHVLIRPRSGDFYYTPAEFDTMAADIAFAKDQGVSGVVFGLLTLDGAIDIPRTRALIAQARPLSVTFHRAIDMTRDPLEALDTLITLGVDRVLTAGGASSAHAGRNTIVQMVARARDHIAIMPGGGISEHNVQAIVQATGVREIHFSARTRTGSPMQYRNPSCSMGSAAATEYTRAITDPNRIRAIIGALSHL